MIFLNFKTYKESSGKNSIKLARIIEEVSASSGIPIIACPLSTDLWKVAGSIETEVWAQHIDPEDRGRATGWLPAQIAKESGATGTLLNHSEHKLDDDTLAKSVASAKQAGLKTLIFVGSIEEARKVSPLKPDFISYEPPELIASKDTSVAKSKPEIIEKMANAIPDLPIIVGAGVKDQNDVKVSLRLGAKGIALASGVIKHQNPKEVLEDLVKGYKSK